MCAGVVGAQVGTLGGIATLVPLGGAALIFNNVLIFQSLNNLSAQHGSNTCLPQIGLQ